MKTSLRFGSSRLVILESPLALGVPVLLGDRMWSGRSAAADKPVRLGLIPGLVELHRNNHCLREADSYFACKLHDAVELNAGVVGQWSPALVGYFADGVRSAFGVWAEEGAGSAMLVADVVSELFVCPPAWLR